jgi:hypothetical protein
MAGLIAIGAVGFASAQTAQKAPADDGDLKVTIAGQTVSIDPQTGRMRALTPEESKALGEALRRQFARESSRPPVVIETANGTMAEVPEEFMEVAVVRLNPDGSLSKECVRGMQAAARSLESPAPMTDDCGGSAPAVSAAKPVTKAAAKSRRPAAAKPARKATKQTAAMTAGRE